MPGTIKTKIIGLIGGVVLALGILVTPVSADSGYAISIDIDTATPGVQSSRELSKGVAFDADVYVQLPDSFVSSGIQFALQFDPKVIKCTAVDLPAGGLFPDGSTITGPNMPELPSLESGIYNDVGYVDIVGIVSYTGVKGSGVILRYSFQVIGEGQANIEFATKNLGPTDTTDVTTSIYDDTGSISIVAPELILTNAAISTGAAPVATTTTMATTPSSSTQTTTSALPPVSGVETGSSSFPMGAIIGIVAGIVVIGAVGIVLSRRGKRA